MTIDAPPASAPSSRLRLWCSWAGSAAVLALCLWILDWGQILTAARQINPAVVLLVLVLLITKYTVMAWRWSLIVELAAGRPVNGAIRGSLVANLLNLLTPANLGGDAYRLSLLQRAEVPTSQALAALASERLLGLVGHLAAYAGCWLVWEQINPLNALKLPFALFALASLMGLIAIGLAVWWLGRGRALPALVPSRFAALLGLVLAFCVQVAQLHRARGMIAPLFGTILAIMLWIVPVWLLACDLGLRLSLCGIGAIVIIVEILRLIPLSVQGIGVREATFAGLLAIIGQSPEIGFVIGAIAYGLLSVVMLMVGLAGVMWQSAHATARRPTQ